MKFLRIFALSACLAAPANAEMAAYSAVRINSFESVLDPAPDFISNRTGAMLELDLSGTTTGAYGNGSGGYTFKPTSSSTYALASLATGELKTLASLAFGPNEAGSATMPIGHHNGSALAMATFGDSFQTFASDSPFLWSDGATATFSFGVTGSSSFPDALPKPTSLADGRPINEISSSLTFTAYKSGGLDLFLQLSNFDFDAFSSDDEAWDQYLLLNDRLGEMKIFSDYRYFGDLVTPFLSSIDPAKILSVNPDDPTFVSMSFNPDGDFDWILDFTSIVFLDAAHENVAAISDFSHTVVTRYIAPEGTTTYSASGVFPGTLALSTAPAVPEPASWAMMIGGFAFMGGALRGRRARLATFA